MWPVLIGCVVVAAVLQLAVVSDVWLPSETHPVGKIKLAIYFFQVPFSHWQRSGDARSRCHRVVKVTTLHDACFVCTSVFSLQMVAFVDVSSLHPSRGTAVANAVLSVLRMQPPSSLAGDVALCVSTSLTSKSKIVYETALPLAVAVAMVTLMVLWRLLVRCTRRGGSTTRASSWLALPLPPSSRRGTDHSGLQLSGGKSRLGAAQYGTLTVDIYGGGGGGSGGYWSREGGCCGGDDDGDGDVVNVAGTIGASARTWLCFTAHDRKRRATPTTPCCCDCCRGGCGS